MIAKDREADDCEVSRDKGGRRIVLVSRLLRGGGQERSNKPLPWPHGAASVAASVAAFVTLRRLVPCFFVLGVFLFHVSFCTVWRPRGVRSFRLHAVHTSACRWGGALLDPFPPFAICLCQAECFHARQLARSVRRSLLE